MANDKLSTYKSKRDFRQMREPSGQDAVKPTNSSPLRHPEARRNPAAL